MLIYGMGYFPLFAGITASSPLGYFVATMFTWCFAAEFFANSFCRQNFDVSVCCYKHFHACTMFMYLGNAWKKWRVYSHWTLRSVWTKLVTFTEVHLQFFKILTYHSYTQYINAKQIFTITLYNKHFREFALDINMQIWNHDDDFLSRLQNTCCLLNSTPMSSWFSGYFRNSSVTFTSASVSQRDLFSPSSDPGRNPS